jgi:diguanylate cyclase
MQDNLPRDLSRETHPTDHIIFHIGEPGDCAYLVESGAIEVVTRSGRAIAIIKAGEIFGEIALLDQLPRTATVRTLEPTVLLRIDRNHVHELLKRTDPVIRHLLTLLLERFRHRSDTSLLHAGHPPTPLERFRSHSDDTPPHISKQICCHEGDVAATNLTLMLAQDLGQAMKNGQLSLAYQPLLSLPDRRLLGFEALIRWNHPILGSIMPTKLIALAEKTGMIRALGLWVLSRAIGDWPTLRQYCDQTQAATPFISINLSAPELANAELAETIDQLLKTSDTPPAQLQLELIETTLIDDLPSTSACLEKLTTRGIGIALDDFGTGYASFEYLSTLPISCLKIDQAFIRDATHDSRRREIVQMAINLARSLGMTTIGEGIEDEATAELLSDLGCNIAQGYFFGRPMPLEAIPDWLTESRSLGRLAAPDA